MKLAALPSSSEVKTVALPPHLWHCALHAEVILYLVCIKESQ
jgi:hypothetical protein